MAKKGLCLLLAGALLSASVWGCMGNVAQAAGTGNLQAHVVEAGPSKDGNPLKGLVPFDGSTTDFPHSMEWFYLPVSAVQTGMNQFDWTALENRLNAVAGRGHQAVFRFYYDYPGEGSGVPQFLINDGLQMNYYNEPADLGGSGYCPDYSNAEFRQSMQNFIKSFGAKYDGDARIGYITIGLLGFWGEWHNWPFDEDTSDGKPDWSIPTAVYTEVLEAYESSFHRTQLLVREPKYGVDNGKYHVGYHDDSFGYATLPASLGGQTWSFMQKINDLGERDKWKTACIGGEVYPPDQASIFSSNPNQGSTGQTWATCLAETHATWLMCERIKQYSGTALNNAKRAARELGYDMQVTTAYYNDIAPGDALQLGVAIKNIGVAPFYYDHTMWPIQIGIKQNNNVIKTWNTNWDLNAIPADGSVVNFDTTITGHGLGEGTYTLCMKVVNPLAGGAVFGFANQGQSADGWLTLGNLQVKKAVVPPADNPFGGETLTSYEAESGSNTLSGGARVSDSGQCSGGRKVGYIGNNSGVLQIPNVNVGQAGRYSLDIYYLTAEQRTVTLKVNGGNARQISCESTGGWDRVGVKTVEVDLHAGNNTLRFEQASGWAPDIDRVVLHSGSGQSTSGQITVDGNLSDWNQISWVYNQNSLRIKIAEDAQYIYFASEDSGKRPNWQIYWNSDNNDGTGYQDSSWNHSGCDYMVENGSLYSHVGNDSSWNWQFVSQDGLTVSQGNGIVELRISKQSIGAVGSLKYGMKLIDSGWSTQVITKNSNEMLAKVFAPV